MSVSLICGVDVETTGFDPEKGCRVIEVCANLYTSDTGVKVYSFAQRLNPGVTIPADASAVHGIFERDLKGMPKFEDIAPKLLAILGKASIFVAHNAAFDANFLANEFSIVGNEIPNHLSVYCTMENSRWATPDGKLPKLSELCFSLGIPYDKTMAHAAEYDVDVMMQAYFKAKEIGFF